MRRFMTTLLGAGLAVLLAGSAHAELFTVERTASPSSVPINNGASNATVWFTQPTTEFPAPPAPAWDSSEPGTPAVLLNYAITYSGTDTITFNNEAFTLSVLFRSYGPGSNGATQTVTWNGTINGTVGRGASGGLQNGLFIDLQPHNVDFLLGDVPFSLFAFSATRPGVSDASAAPSTWDTGTISMVAVSPIPEPGSMALLAMGGLPFLGMIRRRRK